jgi:hypothetical protein
MSADVALFVFVGLAHLVLLVLVTPEVVKEASLSFTQKLVWIFVLWSVPFAGAWLVHLRIDLGWRSKPGTDTSTISGAE